VSFSLSILIAITRHKCKEEKKKKRKEKKDRRREKY